MSSNNPHDRDHLINEEALRRYALPPDDPALEPDATPGRFARHVTDEVLPRPIPSGLMHRQQVDDEGRPLSVTQRHVQGLRGVFGRLLILVPLQTVMLLGARSSFPWTATVTLYGVGILLVSAAVRFLLSSISALDRPTAGIKLGCGVCLLLLILGSGILYTILPAGFLPTAGSELVWAALGVLLFVFLFMSVPLAYLGDHVSPNQSLAAAGVNLLALGIAYVAVALPNRLPFVILVMGCNLGLACQAATQFARWMIANPYLEPEYVEMYHAPWPTLPWREEIRGLAQFLCDYCTMAVYFLVWGLLFLIIDFRLSADHADVVLGFFLLLPLSSIILFALHEVIVSNRRPSLRAYWHTFWVTWKCLAVWSTYQVVPAGGQLQFSRPWSSRGVRLAFLQFTYLLNVAVVFALVTAPLRGDDEPMYLLSPKSKSQPPDPTGPEANLQGDRNRPLAIADEAARRVGASRPEPGRQITDAEPLQLEVDDLTPLGRRRAVKIFLIYVAVSLVCLFLFPTLIVFGTLRFLHGPAMNAYQEFFEERLKRQLPPRGAFGFGLGVDPPRRH
jgi:hypothetical protein